jgi:hypothetical protein
MNEDKIWFFWLAGCAGVPFLDTAERIVTCPVCGGDGGDCVGLHERVPRREREVVLV